MWSTRTDPADSHRSHPAPPCRPDADQRERPGTHAWKQSSREIRGSFIMLRWLIRTHSAELDLDQISALVNDLLAAHGEWIPEALRPGATRSKAA